MFEFRDGKVRVLDWLPLEEVRDRIRALKDVKPIEGADMDAFKGFYNMIVTEENAGPPTSWLWELFNDLRYRETAFVKAGNTQHHINIGKAYFMKDVIARRFEKGDVPFHFYVTAARVDHTEDGKPIDLSDRGRRTVWGFDYLCDIDSPDIMEAKEDAEAAAAHFTTEKIPFAVIFSGRKGFHVRVYYEDLLAAGLVKKKDEYGNKDMDVLFRKLNRQMKKMGATPDKKVKGNTYQMQRAVFSVTGDTPILIRTAAQGVCRVNIADAENLISTQKVDTPTLNEQCEVQWKPIREVIKHEQGEPMYKITTEKGFDIKVTASHSVFVLTEKGIKTKKTCELAVGDYLVAPMKALPTQRKYHVNEEVCITDLIKSQKHMYIHDVPSSFWGVAYSKYKQIAERISTPLPNARHCRYYNTAWRNRYLSRLPLTDFVKLRNKEVEGQFKNLNITYAGSNSAFPLFLPMSIDLFYLLGYFTGDGGYTPKSSIRTKGITLTFGNHSKKNKAFERISAYTSAAFKIRPTPHWMSENAYQVVLNNRILYTLFRERWRTGSNRYVKRIPSVIWNADEELQLAFIQGYLDSDGCVHRRKNGAIQLTFVTVSEELHKDMATLLASLGFNYRCTTTPAGTRKFPSGHLSQTRKAYTTQILGDKELERITSGSPRDNLKVYNKRPLYPLRHNQIKVDSRKNIERTNRIDTKRLPKPLRAIYRKHMAYRKIMKIEQIICSGCVYDLDVGDNHNFLGGTGQFLLHNSMHPESGLVCMPLTQKEFASFSTDMAKPENVAKSPGFGIRRRPIKETEKAVDFLRYYWEYGGFKR